MTHVPMVRFSNLQKSFGHPRELVVEPRLRQLDHKLAIDKRAGSVTGALDASGITFISKTFAHHLWLTKPDRPDGSMPSAVSQERHSLGVARRGAGTA